MGLTGERVNESRLRYRDECAAHETSGRADGRFRLVGTVLLASRLAAGRRAGRALSPVGRCRHGLICMPSACAAVVCAAVVSAVVSHAHACERFDPRRLQLVAHKQDIARLEEERAALSTAGRAAGLKQLPTMAPRRKLPARVLNALCCFEIRFPGTGYATT